MSLRAELKRLLAEDPNAIKNLRQEICVEREEAARKTKQQTEKQRREREVIAQQERMDAECDKPILELVCKCENCKGSIKVSPQVGFADCLYHIRARVPCDKCHKINWVFLTRGPRGEVPLKISATLNPTHVPYFASGKLVLST